ncbi:MAG: tetratricopeptide repeat protein [Planctomycetota bacterium]|jgi:tetratricopeptide (TPR) repeat protein
MAKKRLNKKVALIGSAVFVLVILAVIAVVLHLSRDPQKFIKDGDVALLAKDYDTALRSYNKARGLAQTDELRMQLLFKLADIYIETGQWRNTLGCWNRIIKINTKNPKARFGKLEYVYIMADSGAGRVWQDVAAQASEFIEKAGPELLACPVANLVTYGLEGTDTYRWRYEKYQKSDTKLASYLYLLRGRAALEIAKSGAVTEPLETLAKASGDLQKILDFEPTNIDAYWYLAQTLFTKGRILASKGNPQEKERLAEQARQFLEKAIQLSPENPKAHINLLKAQPMLTQMTSIEQVKRLEPEYIALVRKFPSSPESYSTLSAFYQVLGHEGLDKAVEAAEKAHELDAENVTFAIVASDLNYRRFSVSGQKNCLFRAIELAKEALALSDARDVPGPRQMANRSNIIAINVLLAGFYTEQILQPCEPRTETETTQWLENAQKHVRRIEQFLGSGLDPEVIKWQGLLELAKGQKGNRNLAIRKLNTAYEQFKAAGTKARHYSDAMLSYTLAGIFKDTSELGAVREFLVSALNANIAQTKSEIYLELADVLLRLNDPTNAMSVINIFEEKFGPEAKSNMLRIKAYIKANQFDQAQEKLASAQPNDPNVIKLKIELAKAKITQLQMAMTQKQMQEDIAGLNKTEQQDSTDIIQAELESCTQNLAELVGGLLAIDARSVTETDMAQACNNYIREGRIDQAHNLVTKFLGYFPDNAVALLYSRVLAEPDPAQLSQQRRNDMELQVISEIADESKRWLNLGAFYQRIKDTEKAAEQFRKILKIEADDFRIPSEIRELNNQQRLAAEFLFGIALNNSDWDLAGQIVELAKRENIDGCEGDFYAARLFSAQDKNRDALARLNEAIKQRPIFSHGFMLRSAVNAALGNDHACLVDIRKAASLNPMNGNIAKQLVISLYQRNEKLGGNVSSDQVIETRNALDRAMALNNSDLELLSFYAEYISSTEPFRALAIRQNLQKVAPSMQNALLLGRLAMRMAIEESDSQRKQALFNMAESAFAQAQRVDPNNKEMLLNFSEFYRATGQEEKAKQLLVESQDKKLIWGHYFRSGQLDQAQEILQQSYQDDATDPNVLKALILVAEKTADADAVLRYSKELLKVQENIDNHLSQIQSFLRVGLIKEAEHNLQSFTEKYPNEPRAMLLQAWLAMKQGSLERALEMANRNLEIDPDSETGWKLRGEVNFYLSNYNQAILDLKKSKALSDSPATRLLLAKAYLRSDRDEDAITELQNTINIPEATMEARFLLEEIYFRLERQQKLKKLYDETLDKFPDDIMWLNRAGKFALTQKDFQTAENLYEQAWIKSNENGNADMSALDGYLTALASARKFEKVFAEAGKYVDSDFASIAFLKMAQVKMTLGDQTVAEKYCRKALEKTGTNEILAAEILQKVHTLLGDQTVLDYCREKLAANPDSLAANLVMFNLSNMNAQYNKAIEYIDKCIKVVGPDSPYNINYTVKKAMVLQSAYHKTSDNNYLDSAIALYESLLEKMPNNSSVLNNLAYILAEADVKLQKSLEYARRAHKARPNNASFLDTYSYALYKNGQYQQAAKYLLAAMQQYEKGKISVPAEVYEHLGQIHEKLGEPQKALAVYKQALEVGEGILSEVAKNRISDAIERLSY